MRKLLLAACMLYSVSLLAAPGDTTTVQAHSTIQMNHFGNFDTTIEFPDGNTSYRKVLMTFTLGKYQCPGSPQYCGDWDYTIQNILMTPNGDTVELGRYITPYANAGSPRTPWSWTQRYVFDVTDFYTLLKDSATVRIHYSGYSWGFTGDIHFDFIEGTPPRDVLGVENVWKGSYAYGKTPSINDRIASHNTTAPTGTQSTELKLIISGHGSDNSGCSEFCKKFYEVVLNNNKFDKTDLWRDNCGYNHMYPQSGTWVYNRGNWCPGDVVFPNTHELASVTGGSNFDIDVDFEAHTSAGNNASYSVNGTLFYYDAFNKNVDASLDDIIAPSNHETHFRENPHTGSPIVTVTNTGASTINSIKFAYEIAGGPSRREYTWNGTIASLEKADIEFPIMQDLQIVTGTNTFNVEIVEVNGSADDDATNNKMSSEFEAAIQYPSTIIVNMRTNNIPNETSWEVFDITRNSIVAQRVGAQANTNYSDTVHMAPGMYKLVVKDAGCNGLSWWAAQSAGSGSLKINRVGSFIALPLNGYFGGDFGCGFTQYFNMNWPAGISELENTNASITAYPNPATETVNIQINGILKIEGEVSITDMLGRNVKKIKITDMHTVIGTEGMENGIYNVVYHTEGGNRLQTRVVIAK